MNLDNQGQLALTLQDVIGESIAVLGIKGSGKTNTAAVLIEEILSAGLPLAVVDIEGEYFGLRERFEILVAGCSEHVDVEVAPDQADRLAEFSLSRNVPIILDVSGFSDEEREAFLLAFFQALWTLNFKLRKPYEVVLEEAHESIPQGVRTPLKQALTRIALRGRKRGLGLIAVSQRSAKVEKDILTQAGIVFLHKVIHPTDIKVYQDIVPKPPREVEAMIASLQKGQAIVLANNQVIVTQLRVRHTFHAGATPELDQAAAPELRRVDAATLAALGELFQQPEQSNDIEALHQQVRSLKQTLVEKNAEIERLQKQLGGKGEIRPAQTQAAPVAPRPVVVVQSGVQARDEQRQAVSDERERARQQRQFARVLQQISGASSLHRRLISYLVDHEPQAYELGALDRLLAVTGGTLYKNPPIALLKQGLLQRQASGSGFTYKSKVLALLAQDCPLITPAEIAERIAQAAR